jgi:ABC-type nitrate/sulfonate/bicarbonate transport system permease component
MAVRRALIGFIIAFAVASCIAVLTTARQVHHTSSLSSPITQI